MSKPSRSIAFIAAGLAALLLAACGDTAVGNKALFNNTAGGQAALGNEPTPTPAPAATATAPAQVAAATPAPARSQATPAPAPKPQSQKFAIGVFGDNSGHPQFDPSAARVYTNTAITFTNHDTVARSVVSDASSKVQFNSGPIAPGGTWTYTATTVGSFNYADGTRPYAVASFQVISP